MASLESRLKELEDLRDHAGIIRLCHTVLQRRNLSSDDQFAALMALGKNLHIMNPFGWISQTRSALKEALVVAAGNPRLQVQALVSLSVVEIDAGQPEQIEETLRQFEAIVEPRPDVPNVLQYRGAITNNIARACECVRDHVRAEQNYRRALEYYRGCSEQGDPKLQQRIGRTLHNLAHVLVKLGRISEARATAAEANSLIANEYGEAGAKKLCLAAKIEAADGRFSIAERLFAEALRHPGLDDFTRVDIMWFWAEADYGAGNREAAVERAQAAHVLATKMPYPEAIQALEELLLQAGGDTDA